MEFEQSELPVPNNMSNWTKLTLFHKALIIRKVQYTDQRNEKIVMFNFANASANSISSLLFHQSKIMFPSLVYLKSQPFFHPNPKS